MGEVVRDGTPVELPEFESQDFKKLVTDRVAKQATKLAVLFETKGDKPYRPHVWQLLAHTCLSRFLLLGAGRRGGKTLGAAEETALRSLPLKVPEYEWDDGKIVTDNQGKPVVIGETTLQRQILGQLGVNLPPKNKPIKIAIVTPTHNVSDAPKEDYFRALESFDYMPLNSENRATGKTYQHNKVDQITYIPNAEKPECKVYWKSADKPNSLRSQGYHHALWDEPASVMGREAWDAFSPTLAQTLGTCIFATTPGAADANWWVWELLLDPEIPHVSTEVITWLSIENPYFPVEEIEREQNSMHPKIFRREYMGRWERGGGEDLKEEWIQKVRKDELHVLPNGQLDPSRYTFYIGVDPAISPSARADYFVASVIAVDNETYDAVLVEIVRDKIDFPSQIELLVALNAKYSPQSIGIEATAYQTALIQQLSRIDGMPRIQKIDAYGRKEERILAVGPVFKEGRIKVLDSPGTNLTLNLLTREWIEFPNSKHDDVLDGTDIAIRTAGLILTRTVRKDEPTLYREHCKTERPTYHELMVEYEMDYDEWQNDW